MEKYRLLTTRRLPPHLESRATAEYRVTRWDSRERPLAEASPGQDAILCNPAITVDNTVIGALAPSVRVIGTFSVGFDHIDVAAARARGIAVVHTPAVLSGAVAEFTMLLLLAAARRAGEAERLLRAGQWLGPSPESFQGVEVSGKPLGIFGMGRIGQALARMARGFDMQVHYRNRSRLPQVLEAGAQYHDNDSDFLAQSAFLAICAPANAQTQGWLNAARIAALPRGAVVVNTARGSLVDDDALGAALREGHVRAAGLDVFVREPSVPDAYLGMENVVLTPHIASATDEARAGMANSVLDGIGAVLAGRRPENLL